MRNMTIFYVIPHIIEVKLKKYKSHHKGPTISKALAKCVCNTEAFLCKHANIDLRTNFFTPWACAKASDMSGGRINGTTFTVLWEVYTKGVKTPDCLLPSASSEMSQASTQSIRLPPRDSNAAFIPK